MSSHANSENDKKKVDGIIQSAAARIVKLIEDGSSPQWRKTWAGNPLIDMPYNPVTGHKFSGFNRSNMMLMLMDSGLSDPRFMTFNQVSDLAEKLNIDLHVRAKEKAIYALKPLIIKRKEVDQDDLDGDNESRPVFVKFKPYPVFHASQIENMPDMQPAPPVNWDDDNFIESLIVDSDATVVHGGDRAYFRPSSDLIRMPYKSDFESREEYYSTLLHEWYHWTGHEAREGRQFGKSFGDESYAIEELRAESFSALCGAALGLPISLENHAAYLDGWKKKLNDSDGVKEILKAMNEAGNMLDAVMTLKNGEKPKKDWWPEEEPSPQMT